MIAWLWGHLLHVWAISPALYAGWLLACLCQAPKSTAQRRPGTTLPELARRKGRVVVVVGMGAWGKTNETLH